MSEHDEQVLLFDWAQIEQQRIPELALMFAVPNAAKRSYGVAAYMKAEGLKSGVPDIFLPVARGGYHGLFLEMKYGRGKPSDNQTAWIAALQEQGYRAVVVYGFEHAQETIISYLEMINSGAAGTGSAARG